MTVLHILSKRCFFGENCWTNVAPQQHLMGGNEEFRCREECSIFFMWECARFELLLLKVGRKNVHRNCIIKKKLKLCIQRVLRHPWNATFNLSLQFFMESDLSSHKKMHSYYTPYKCLKWSLKLQFKFFHRCNTLPTLPNWKCQRQRN